MPDRQIFFDPQCKRWKRLRRILDATAVISTLVLAVFIFNVLRYQQLPELLLPIPGITTRHCPTAPRSSMAKKPRTPPAARPAANPLTFPSTPARVLRAAYYVEDDPASYSSFKEHVHQIDLLFPQWLHIDAPQPTILAMSADHHHEYPVVDAAAVHDPDEGNKIKHVIEAAKEDTEVFPHLNNYNPNTQSWDPAIGVMLADPAKRAALRQQIVRFLAAFPAYRGLSLDIESLPDNASPGYISFIRELYADLHPRNLRLYVNTMVSTTDEDLKGIAANSDGLVLMNYDEHQVESQPGPVASQEWFVNNLRRAIKIVPKEKLICALGNYGYDWTLSIPQKKTRPPRQAAPGAQHRRPLRLRCLAARLRRRCRSEPRLRHAQSSLRVH